MNNSIFLGGQPKAGGGGKPYMFTKATETR